MNSMKNFITALQFLTNITVSKNLKPGEKTLAKSTPYFPAVGIIIGCFLAGVYIIFSKVFPGTVVSAIIIASLIWLTRGFHLDGFMDTVDGLFGGVNKDDALRIMKDTRAGSFGIIAVFSLLLLKFTLLLELTGKEIFPLILVLMPALGRWSMVCTMPFYPYQREKGTASFTKFVGKNEALISSAVMLVFAAGLLRVEGLILILYTFIFMLLISTYISSKIGGMTGDTYGAVNEITEVLVLALFFIIHSGP